MDGGSRDSNLDRERREVQQLIAGHRELKRSGHHQHISNVTVKLELRGHTDTTGGWSVALGLSR